MMLKMSMAQIARHQAKAKKTTKASSPSSSNEKTTIRSSRLERREWEGKVLTIEIDLEPRPKERARTFIDNKAIVRAFISAGGNTKKFMASINGQGGEKIMRSITPESTRQYEDAIALVTQRAMANAQLDSMECPVEMEIVFRFKGKEGVWPTAQNDGDLDNLEKALLDGMEKGGGFINDRLVVRKTAVKICSETPGITLTIKPASP